MRSLSSDNNATVAGGVPFMWTPRWDGVRRTGMTERSRLQETQLKTSEVQKQSSLGRRTIQLQAFPKRPAKFCRTGIFLCSFSRFSTSKSIFVNKLGLLNKAAESQSLSLLAAKE